MEAAPSGPTAATPTTVAAGVDEAQRLAGPEWWERLAARSAAWWQRLERWVRLRTIALWLVLAGLLVTFAVYPEFRAGLRTWLWLYLLLIGWFLVARTKTVSWRLLAGVFSVAVWWSLGIAVISMWLSSRAGGVRGDGAGTVIAGMTEESLKLVPLAVLALAAPGRVRRLAVVDWLLLGFACGLGFQAFEELARRTSVAVVRPGLLDALDRLLASISGADPYGAGSGYPQYGWSLLSGGSGTPLAGYAGHHILAALVAVTVGLGVTAWRHAAHPRANGARGWQGGRGWRVVALVGPLAVWWLVVADHVGFNATGRTNTRAWAQAGNAPRLLRATWDLSGHGFGRGWLLLAVLALALLVDARHLRRTPRPNLAEAPRGAARTITDNPTLAADRWTARLTSWRPKESQTTRSALPLRAVGARWAAAAVTAACTLLAYTIRDIMVLVAGHARQPDETRLAALARGRLALYELHRERGDAIAATTPADTTRRRTATRALALLGLAVLLTAGLLLAPILASQVGPTLTSPPFPWLAGALDALGDWWTSLGLGGQITVGIGLAALIALSGGSLGLAFGLSGAATYLLDHAHGLATFTRDPVVATRRYLAGTTPQGAIVDLGEFALTFAPGNLAGATAGRFSRLSLLRRLGPRLNLGRLAAGKTVILADGTTMARLGHDELATFTRWGDTLRWDPPRATGAARAYQIRIYGDREPLVYSAGRTQTWADGLNHRYGSMGDTKFREKTSSFYDLKSLHQSMQPIARRKIDKVLLGYRQVIDDPANPARTLEIMTNDPGAAQAFAERMRALGVRGYVVIHP